MQLPFIENLRKLRFEIEQSGKRMILVYQYETPGR